MSEMVGEAVLRIRTDDSGVDPSREGKKAGESYSKGFGGGIKSLGLAIAGTLVAGKALSFAKASVAEARESQKVNATTEQIIKSTGGAANITAKQVGTLTSAISAKAGVDDEAIQSGSNLLLTFANVRNEVGKGNDVFNQATQAAVDLSAAGFGSITGASVQLGKALNDPIKGISALGRSGVTFTQQQQDQIKALVASGDTLKAQKIILGAVQDQVGGVAAASATMGEKAGVAVGNLKESFGNVLLPVLNTVEGVFVNHIAPALQDVLTGTGGISRGFNEVKGTVTAALSPVISQVVSLAHVYLPQIAAFVTGQLIPALVQIGHEVQPVLATMSNTFRTVILPAVIGLGQYVIANLVPILGQVAGIIATQVVPTILVLAQFIYGELYPAVVAIVTQVAHNLLPVFNQLVQTFKTSILPTIQRLIIQIRTQLIPVLEPLVLHIVKVIGFLLKVAAVILSVVLPPLLRLVGFLLAHLIPVIVTVIVFVVKFINALINIGIHIGKAIGWFLRFTGALLGFYRDGIKVVLDAITGLPGLIFGLGGKMLNAGKHLIGSLLSGLNHAGGFIHGLAGNIWDVLKGLIDGAIDSINNALEFQVSLGFGKHISINPPDIPRLAHGTSDFGGGLAWVGESGPELAVLPKHTQVIPAAASAALAGAGTGNPIVILGDVRPHNYRDFQREMMDRGRLAALGGPRPIRGTA